MSRADRMVSRRRTLCGAIHTRLLRLAPGQAITWTVVSRVVSLYERRELMRDAGGDGDGPRRTGR